MICCHRTHGKTFPSEDHQAYIVVLSGNKLCSYIFCRLYSIGLKSRANILPEMSRASTISTPSVEEFCQLSVDWGRANAIIKRTTAKTRKTKLKCRR